MVDSKISSKFLSTFKKFNIQKNYVSTFLVSNGWLDVSVDHYFSVVSSILTECTRFVVFSKAKCNKCITKPISNVLKERFDKSKQNKTISTIHTILEIKKTFIQTLLVFFFFNEHKSISKIKKICIFKEFNSFQNIFKVWGSRLYQNFFGTCYKLFAKN